MPTISQFREAAQAGGFLRLDTHDPNAVQRYGRGILGKVITWIHTKLHPGQVGEQNRAVMQSFVAAFRERYGEGFATMASGRLDLSGARPLSARTVRGLIQEGDRHRQTTAALNTLTREQFSIANNFGTRDFGWVWYQTVAAKGIQRGFSLELWNHARLSRGIAREIDQATRLGRHLVSNQEAEAIARRAVEKFISTKQTLLHHIDTMNLSEAEKTLLTDMVRRNEDISSPQQLDAIWSTREASSALITFLSQNPPPSREEIILKFNIFATTCDQALVSLIRLARETGKEFAGDEMLGFRDHVIQLALALAGRDQDKEASIYNLLTSPIMRELRDVLRAIKTGDFVDTQANVALASTLDHLLTVTIMQTASRLGKKPDHIHAALTTPLKVHTRQDIPEDIASTLRSVGFGTYDPTDLTSILGSPQGFKDFLEFSQTRYADENVLFWAQVQEFSVAAPDRKQHLAQSIIENFIRPGAPKDINIDGPLRNQILHAVQENHLDGVFDEAQEHIFHLMQNDILPRFLSSFSTPGKEHSHGTATYSACFSRPWP